MKNSKAAAQHSQDLLSDLQALGAEATAMISDSAGEYGEEALQALRNKLDVAQERFSEIYGETKKRAIQAAGRADEVIRENPYQAALIGAGIGLVVGILVGRASNSD